jgi:1,4-dihydroxy-2-naphthoate polyprenyltransferase
MMQKARRWLAAIRPATLTAAVGPVAVGTAFAQADKRLHVGAAVAALASATFIQVGTNLFNDYGDHIRGADTDKRLGPDRALQQGWFSTGQILGATVLAFAVATALGLYLVHLAGWPIVVIGIASVLSGLLYTGGPYPLAYVGLGDVFVMLFFGLVAVCGSYWIQAKQLTDSVVLSSLAIGALATAILVVNNLRDRAGDKAVGKKTLVVRFGARFGRIEYASLILLAYAVPAFLVATERVATTALLALASAPFAIQATWAVFRSEDKDLNPQLGATARTGLLYALLLSVGVAL